VLVGVSIDHQVAKEEDVDASMSMKVRNFPFLDVVVANCCCGGAAECCWSFVGELAHKGKCLCLCVVGNGQVLETWQSSSCFAR